MIKNGSSLILTDENIDGDKRIQRQLEGYENNKIFKCDAVVLSDLLQKISSYVFIVKVFVLSLFYWQKFYFRYKIKPNGFFRGLKRSCVTYSSSKAISNEIINLYEKDEIELIHANNLQCGLVGLNITKHFKSELIYDAHEIEFHRNRKNGFLRVIYDILLEKKVIVAAERIIVVNKPIKELYIDIYNIKPSKITIVDNNHFQPYMNYALDNFSGMKDIVIVYIGGGILGRKLEDLALQSNDKAVPVYGFFMSDIPKVAYEFKWHIGSKDYIDEFLELVKSKKAVMWCCTDDVCLSYRLSLPNKFFQAMAVGIPVIAYKDTYLAEIVSKYTLGYIYNDENFQEIVDSLADKNQYYRLLESIAIFQKKLFEEALEL